MPGDESLGLQLVERRMRRWRALKLVAAGAFLAVPVDLALGNWVSGSIDKKGACYTPLPGYQTALAGFVPALFVVVALGCAVAGAVTTVRGRRHQLRAERNAGRTVLALSIPALATSGAFGFFVWLTVGFSTWCF